VIIVICPSCGEQIKIHRQTKEQMKKSNYIAYKKRKRKICKAHENWEDLVRRGEAPKL